MDIIQKLRAAAQLINEAADAMEGAGTTQEPAKEPAPEPVKEPVQEKKVTFEEVRAVLADKATKGFADQVKELVHKYNVSKLSEIPEAEYPTVLKEAEAIG